MPSRRADGPKKLTDWWQAALETMRINNQAVLKANSRILSTWSEMARKVNGDAADTMADLAKKTSEQAEQMAKASVDRFKEMANQASGKADALMARPQGEPGEVTADMTARHFPNERHYGQRHERSLQQPDADVDGDGRQRHAGLAADRRARPRRRSCFAKAVPSFSRSGAIGARN